MSVLCTLPQRALLAPQCVVVNRNGLEAFQWSAGLLQRFRNAL